MREVLVKPAWNRQFKKIPFIFPVIITLFGFGVILLPVEEGARPINKLTPQIPRYELKLNFVEFMMFHNSILNGLKKYGGEVDFSVKMANVDNGFSWTIGIKHPVFLKVLQNWLTEYSAQFIKTPNPDNSQPVNKTYLTAIKVLSEKLTYSQDNPVWDLVKMPGLVMEKQGQLFIVGDQGCYKVTGSKMAQIEKEKGKRIVAHGHVKVTDQLEVVKFIKVKENTLELFVMSLCPFSQGAEVSIIQFLNHPANNVKPQLKIHYLFYKVPGKEKTRFTSLRGEVEVEENLVQMVIRDHYSPFFYPYLMERAKNDAPWEQLAVEIGMKTSDIEAIYMIMDEQRDTLMEKEYRYVTQTYGILDKSPTITWESDIVEDLQHQGPFAGLKDFNWNGGNCSK